MLIFRVVVIAAIFMGVMLKDLYAGESGAFGGNVYEYDYTFKRDAEAISEADFWISEQDEHIEVELKDPGAIKVFSGFRYATTYDSNFFKKRRDTKEELAHAYVSYLGWSRGRPGVSSLYSNLTYSLSYVDYIQNEHLSRLGHEIYHTFSLKSNKMSFTFTDIFNPDTSVSLGERRDLSDSLGSNAVTFSNVMNAKLDYMVTSKLTLTNSYSHIFKYLPASFNQENVLTEQIGSYQMHKFSPRLRYQIGPKTSLIVNYEIENSDYFRDGDTAHDAHTILGGVAWQPTLKTRIYGEMGYYYLRYKQPSFKDGSGLVYKANASYEISPLWSVMLNANQRIGKRESLIESDGSFPESDYYSFALRFTPSETLRLSAGASYLFDHKSGLLTLPDIDNPSISFTRLDETTTMSCDLSVSWNTKLGWDFVIGYQHLDVNKTFKDNEYERYKIDASIVYRM